MDKQQFATLVIGIKSAYPASKILEDNASMDFWYMMLRDIPYEIAENAVMEHISTNIYPPNIAEIRKLCADRLKRPVLSFDEAWGTVQTAMSKYGSYNAERAFAEMDDLTRSVVKNLGWTRMCQSENPTADRANFREAYETKAKEAQNSLQMPAFVTARKAQLQQQYIPEIEEKLTPKIEKREEVRYQGIELTDEQKEKRSRQVEELRKGGMEWPRKS